MNYYCTAGRGTECFIEEELRLKLNVAQGQITCVDGKVFFQTESPVQKLLHLKCVERIFIQVYRDKEFRMLKRTDIYQIQKTIPNLSNWITSITFWKECLVVLEAEKCKRTSSGEKDCDNCGSPSSKCLKLSPQPNVTFRVSCKCTGKAARLIDSQRLGRQLSVGLSRRFGWKSNLKDPNTEISIHINSEGLTVGIPITRQPLSDRSYLQTIGLRSTVAYIMCSLASIQKGDTVLDPMCGVGTILIEANDQWQSCSYMGCDILEKQLKKSLNNIKYANMTSNITLFQADVRMLPLLTHSVDVIICDVPFGINHSSLEEVKDLYPTMLLEMDRVVRPGGKIVLLTSQNLKDLLINTLCNIPNDLQPLTQTNEWKQLKTADIHTDQNVLCLETENMETSTEHYEKRRWILLKSHYLKLGETDSFLCLFNKS